MSLFFLLLKLVPRSSIKPDTRYQCGSKLDATETNNTIIIFTADSFMENCAEKITVRVVRGLLRLCIYFCA